MEDITSYIEIIGNFGFPVVVSIILLRTLLLEFNKRLDGLDKRLTQLNRTMMLLVKKLENDETNNDEL